MASTINEALWTRLTGVSGLSALVSARVYPGYAPQNATRPFVTYFLVTRTHYTSHDGSSGAARSRYQFSAWSDNYLEAEAVAEQIRLALQGYAGTIDSCVIGAVLPAGDGPITYDEETELYQVPVDYYVIYEEAQS